MKSQHCMACATSRWFIYVVPALLGFETEVKLMIAIVATKVGVSARKGERVYYSTIPNVVFTRLFPLFCVFIVSATPEPDLRHGL